MPDPLTEAVKEATNTQLSTSQWYAIVVMFLFGGASSAFWTWRQGIEAPKMRDIISSFFMSGLISVGVVSALMAYKVPFLLCLSIAIFTGIGGDMVGKLGLQKLRSLLVRFFPDDASSKSKRAR